MTIMAFKKIGVIGAGMMGAEIALCFAQAGFEVIMSDANQGLADKGKERQAKVLDKQISKGKLEAGAKDSILGRVKTTAHLSAMADCDLIIEAVLEDLEVKAAVFAELDKVVKPACIFASNTSSIPITKIATSVSPERQKAFLGMHFFSPASVMRLVEIIPGFLCANEAVEAAREAVKAIGKSPVTIKDVAGFAVNRLLNIFFIEAIRLLEEGVASIEDIDTACKLGLGHPVGPFELLDLTTLDLNLKVHTVLFNEYGERFRPRPLLRKMVTAGLYGRKSGQGFHKYNK
jgi:3-hydroxybutyryl-CoA dehydrogenase